MSHSSLEKLEKNTELENTSLKRNIIICVDSVRIMNIRGARHNANTFF